MMQVNRSVLIMYKLLEYFMFYVNFRSNKSHEFQFELYFE